MLEALVSKDDGVIILVAKPGKKWGRNDNGPDSTFVVVQLDDPTLEIRLGNKLDRLDCVTYPYGEWEIKTTTVDVDADRRTQIDEPELVQASVRRVPLNARQPARQAQNRTVMDARRLSVDSLTEIPKRNPANVVGPRPDSISRPVIAAERNP